MSFFVVALLGGFAGSFHCVGMCGGFVCGIAQMNTGPKTPLVIKNILYNAGRLLSYVFIGALAGALGSTLIGTPPSVDGMSAGGMVMAGEAGLVQRLLSVVAGVLMIVMAFQLLGILRHLPFSWGRIAGVTVARAVQTLIRSNRPAAALTLGVANGFLPCPLVFAFAATAAASASIGVGAVTMLGFGLGTFPAMLFMSGVGLALPPVVRLCGVRFAGVFVLVVGVLTIIRGLLPAMMHGAAHAPSM